MADQDKREIGDALGMVETRGLVEKIEELAPGRTRVDVSSVGQQLHRTAAARRVEQARAELFFENVQKVMQLLNREATPPQICQHEQLEEFDWRITPLGIAAGRRA